MMFCGVGKDPWGFLGQQGDPTNPSLKEISPECLLEGRMLKLKFQHFDCLMGITDSFERDPDAGKDWKWEKGTTEDEMVG